MSLFAERIRFLRKEKKLKQTDMAVFLGITSRHYQDIEYGKIDLPTSKTIILANYFDVPLDYLTGRSDDKYVAVAAAVPQEFHNKIFQELEKMGITKAHIKSESPRACVVGEGFIVDDLTPSEVEKASKKITEVVNGIISAGRSDEPGRK